MVAGPTVVAGRPLPDEYTKENLGLLEKGIVNMTHLIGVIRKSGINPVVCINCLPYRYQGRNRNGP